MFCPKCAAQNEDKQGYCRQCGQSLATVQLALDGRADEAVKSFEQARRSLNYGLSFLGMFALIGLATFILGGAVPYVVLLIGFAVCLPSILKGITLLRRVGHLLEASKHSGNRDIQGSVRSAIPPPEIATTDPTRSLSEVPDSVTADTTLELEGPKFQE